MIRVLMAIALALVCVIMAIVIVNAFTDAANGQTNFHTIPNPSSISRINHEIQQETEAP